MASLVDLSEGKHGSLCMRGAHRSDLHQSEGKTVRLRLALLDENMLPVGWCVDTFFKILFHRANDALAFRINEGKKLHWFLLFFTLRVLRLATHANEWHQNKGRYSSVALAKHQDRWIVKYQKEERDLFFQRRSSYESTDFRTA